jgi:chemotaxis protein CheC
MTQTIDRSHLELLQGFFTAATHDASAAMCRWTNGLITLSLDEIVDIPLEDVAHALQLGDERLAMVVLTLSGELGGTMVLTFDETNGRGLAAALIGRTAPTTDAWSALEQSALNETGNILSCAYMNALTRLIDAQLVPSPPLFLQDYGASVLQQAVLSQVADADEVMVCRTGFHREGQVLNWNVIFVPSLQLRTTLLSKLGGCAVAER